MTYENKMSESSKNIDQFKSNRVNIPIIKYFWQASPLARNKKKSLHRFLRHIKVLSKLSDLELKLLSGFLHERQFEANEVIFNKGDRGFGFYFVFSGVIEIYLDKKDHEGSKSESHLVNLTQHQYFGELALLDEGDVRNASARSSQPSTLYALFRPDLEELIERHPVVAAKLLQSISLIITKRFIDMAQQVQVLKEKISRYEQESN